MSSHLYYFASHVTVFYTGALSPQGERAERGFANALALGLKNLTAAVNQDCSFS